MSRSFRYIPPIQKPVQNKFHVPVPHWNKPKRPATAPALSVQKKPNR